MSPQHAHGAEGYDVVTLGETMIQLSPGAETLAEASSLRVGIGGAESNLACLLAAAGVRVAWVSAVGDDPFGRRIVDEIAAYGVEVGGVRTRTDAPTGLYVKEPQPGGTRVHYYRAGSAAARLGPGDLSRLPLAGARVLHLTGITPALSASCADLVEASITAARAHGVLVTFDVNHRPKLWPDRRRAADALARLARQCDLVLVGRDEAEALWGTDTARDAADCLGVAHLVVKDGAIGATSFRHGEEEVFVAAPRVDVVEPVGAGDAFAAGYLHALCAGGDERDRLTAGHRFAALALGAHGDLPSVAAARAALAHRIG